MARTIVIVGTMDTKGREVQYIKELIEKRGHRTIIIDAGMRGEPCLPADIGREQVAHWGGKNLDEIAASGGGDGIATMAHGASEIVQRLYDEGKVDGIIGIGGTLGTSLTMTVAKALPLFVPKVMVSTLAHSPYIQPDAPSRDLIIAPAVVELGEGPSEITKAMLRNAAGAIVGMVETYERHRGSGKPVIAIPTFGAPVSKYQMWARPLLEQKGYDVVVLPGVGTSFEELAEQGMIAGALDFMACNRLINTICGGVNKAGPNRLVAGMKRGIPQVFAPAIIEYFSWVAPLESLPPQYRNRQTYQHSAFVLVVKTSKEEKVKAAEIMAEKLDEMTGPTAMLLPNQGFSEVDRPGNIFHDPEGRRAFIETIRKRSGAKASVIELDMHISDPAFAEEAVTILDNMMRDVPGESIVPRCSPRHSGRGESN